MISSRSRSAWRIDDLIAMKRESDRPRDPARLEILGALRDELDSPG